MRTYYRAGFGLFLFATLFLFTACEQKVQKEEEKTILRSVKYITLDGSNNARWYIYSGTSRAFREASLSFRVGGIINNIMVVVGDSLKEGDTIAQLEKTSYLLEVEKARVSLAQAKSDRRTNESKYSRQKRLYENRHASKEDLDMARALLESSRAQVSLAQKSLKLSQLDLSYTTLKSTDECLVAEVFKEVNENVKTGEKILALYCGKGSEVEVLLPENIIDKIQKNMPASVKFSSIPNKIFDAKVSEISVGSASGTAYPVTLSIDNEGHTLRSGLSAEVTFQLENNKGSEEIYIPLVSVREDTLGRYVYVLEDTNTTGEGIIRRQSVSIGELSALGVKITQGLKPKQKVVTAGMSVIRDGLIVKSD